MESLFPGGGIDGSWAGNLINIKMKAEIKTKEFFMMSELRLGNKLKYIFTN